MFSLGYNSVSINKHCQGEKSGVTGKRFAFDSPFYCGHVYTCLPKYFLSSPKSYGNSLMLIMRMILKVSVENHDCLTKMTWHLKNKKTKKKVVS